jgi:hypothetical protein
MHFNSHFSYHQRQEGALVELLMILGHLDFFLSFVCDACAQTLRVVITLSTLQFMASDYTFGNVQM